MIDPPEALQDRFEVRGRVPNGFKLLLGFASATELAPIVEWCRTQIPWEKRRRGNSAPAQFYAEGEGTIPAWATGLGHKMEDLGIFAEAPNHVMVLKYVRGKGMHPHVDFPDYGPVVAGLTIGSSRVLRLTRRRARTRVLLHPGDLYVLEEDARYLWEHAIEESAHDTFRGQSYERNEGFSVTWRLRS